MPDIRLPQIKEVHLTFDYDLIAKSLGGFSLDTIPSKKKLLKKYIEVQKAEIKLLHIKSCCEKALNEKILPYKDKLWEKILTFTSDKE